MTTHRDTSSDTTVPQATTTHIGVRLREARKSAGLTQHQLARQIECHDQEISRYERGAIEPRPRPPLSESARGGMRVLFEGGWSPERLAQRYRVPLAEVLDVVVTQLRLEHGAVVEALSAWQAQRPKPDEQDARADGASGARGRKAKAPSSTSSSPAATCTTAAGAASSSPPAASRSSARGRPPMGRPTTPSVQTVSGALVDLYHPTPHQIRVDDIAHALGALARFNGHTSTFYSVAEHSVRVSRRVPPEDALWGLIHDAAEAYIGDIVSPVKALCPEVAVIEAALLRVICQKLGLRWEMPASVVEADARMLATEARDLLRGDTSWCKAQPYDDEIIRPAWTSDPIEAAEEWLQRFEELTGGAHG